MCVVGLLSITSCQFLGKTDVKIDVSLDKEGKMSQIQGKV